MNPIAAALKALKARRQAKANAVAKTKADKAARNARLENYDTF